MRCRADTVTEAIPGLFDSGCAVSCFVFVTLESVMKGRGGAVLGMEFRWVCGRERAVFESFVCQAGGRSEADDNCSLRRGRLLVWVGICSCQVGFSYTLLIHFYIY